MTVVCRNGHDSTWPDWCSVCGEKIGADPAAAAPSAAQQPGPTASAGPAVTAASGLTCSNCGTDRGATDVFCENCGFDFASGSLPDVAATATAAGAAPLAPFHVKVSIDPAFFAATVGDVELALPDPLPATTVVPLPGGRSLIGRQSTSRGIFPEIDLQALTGDPAVSSRHAMLERAHDGTWTITDLGSTNGTFVSADAATPIAAGQARPIAAAASIFIGAWSRLDLTETT